MQGRLWPRSDEERRKAEEAGYDISKVCSAYSRHLAFGSNILWTACSVLSVVSGNEVVCEWLPTVLPIEHKECSNNILLHAACKLSLCSVLAAGFVHR